LKADYSKTVSPFGDTSLLVVSAGFAAFEAAVSAGPQIVFVVAEGRLVGFASPRWPLSKM